MKAGTAETKINRREAILQAGLRSGFRSGGGRNKPGGGGSGGDRFPGNDFSDVSKQNSSNKIKITVWFVLLIVLMTFGGLIAAYILTATNKVLEWHPFDLPRPILLSTALIIASSLTYKIFQSKLNAGKQEAAKPWLVATTVLGASFISSQLLAWLALSGAGVYVQSNPYAGFFYILTAVHAAHVIGGISALGYIVLRAWQKTSSEIELEQRKSIAKSVGWYWHFMDGLWLVLFLLLGFYK